MKFHLLAIVSLAGALSASSLAGTSDTQADVLANEKLKPGKNHQTSSRYIAHFLSEGHYLKTPIKNNDELSGKILDKYIERYDPNRIYFYQQDIRSFERYRLMMDNVIESGNLQSVYDIHSVYKQRQLERFDFAIKLLDKPFDFKKDEEFIYDREELDWPSSEAEMNLLWKRRVKADALALMLAEKNWDEIKEILSKRYNMAKRRMEQMKSEDVFSAYMNAYALTIEPHASYLSPRDAENFDIEMKLSLEGIGAILQADDVYTKITKLVTGAPAEKSKQLKEGDRIVGVGQADGEIKDVISWRLDDVVSLIRGEAGSEVRLQVLPKDEVIAGETKLVTLVREKVKLEELSAKSKVIEIEQDGKPLKMGVISIPKFYVDWDAKFANRSDYKSTSRDVRKFIKQLEAENIDGLIIDLRNNGGGALDEAVELTGLFIDYGPVVQQRDQRGRITAFSDSDRGVAYKGELAVLVNGNSASASEIFAGAIQDYGRGIIVGEQTFGKGTVQSLVDLNRFRGASEGSLGKVKWTTSKFYRVSGETTQHRGVVPDISFPSAFSREEYGESAYDNALVWDTISAASFNKTGKLTPFVAQLKSRHQQRAKQSLEFGFLAEDIEEFLKKKERKSVSLNLEKRKKEIEENKLSQLERVNSRLKKKGMKPVESLKDFDDSVFEKDDFRLEETGNILADFITLKHRKKLAELK
ncbi:carboxy terminal-processing peptidase [Pleionea sp. CnH1-48]|nr:carboxy terminal-processing peptidase [Pleionea sp. CnH1-48]